MNSQLHLILPAETSLIPVSASLCFVEQNIFVCKLRRHDEEQIWNIKEMKGEEKKKRNIYKRGL